MSVAGRHVVVTGGGTGVGRAMTEAFAAAGATVTAMGRRDGPLREVAAGHDGIGWATCDVTDRAAVARAFETAREERGPVSVVVANAGAAESMPFARLSPEQLSAMLAVNLGGVVNAWQAGLDDMTAAGWGRLIAVASTAGLKGYAYVTAYAAAKHAVVGLTRSLALELGESGVTANALCPGFIETPLLDRSIATITEKTGMDAAQARASLMRGNPQKRFIQPGEVAGAALWLCSDSAGSVNGHALAISGGET
ncbi:SDR family NAD(P)-dependent oxidoreductase [Jannaschia formosa]|uniref:SDR family NAD(P)-dependent oxidoreductase n=1 Tax=Jannaschia formosa TaxID=2259592 RepID=UPI000E1BB8C4|nr:SDR family NAD(P)-dependent oxidoreductase [Jannaschia formosa]TFL19790.1 SDR family NAD(P)-dependent oxidoreductase [Jannaschia formosa]